jgi:type I restriction enzyme S subunit
MNNWEEELIGNLVASVSETYKFTDEEVVFLNTSDILAGKFLHSNLSKPSTLPGQAKKQIQKGDLLFSEIRPANKRYALVTFDSSKYVVSTKLMVLRSKGNIDSKYLEYFLTSKETLEYLQMLAEDRSGTFPQITFDNIAALKIKVPTKSIQKSTVNLLDDIENKISLLETQILTCEKLAFSLFFFWFIENPSDDWKTLPLSKAANFLNGLACQKFPPKNETDKLPVLKIKELSSGITENSDWASTEIKPEYIVKNGDVIFAWSASLMLKIWDGQDCILNQHLFKVTSEEYPKWFYYLWCKHYLAEFISIAASHATTMGHIKRGDLDEAKVLIPNPDELAVMTAQAEPLINKIIANNIQINTLTKLRDSLLPKLMSGEITINTN